MTTFKFIFFLFTWALLTLFFLPLPYFSVYAVFLIGFFTRRGKTQEMFDPPYWGDRPFSVRHSPPIPQYRALSEPTLLSVRIRSFACVIPTIFGKRLPSLGLAFLVRFLPRTIQFPFLFSHPNTSPSFAGFDSAWRSHFFSVGDFSFFWLSHSFCGTSGPRDTFKGFLPLVTVSFGSNAEAPC